MHSTEGEIPKIDFREPAMKPVFDNFAAVFGPGSRKTADLPDDVKLTVWIRMINAFHPIVKPRDIRLHFIKTFHPDTGTGFLSVSEKNRVMAMESLIFRREGGRL